MIEKSLIILKPDCMRLGLCGQVITRFENEGFKIIAAKIKKLEPNLLREHYAHVADLPFFPEIEKFMSSEPVLIFILSGKNVISRVRDLLGPTDSNIAPKGTIRGDLGSDRMRNVVHASDSAENASIEINRFFSELS